MAQKTEVHGHSVAYEDNAREGISYLRDDLSTEEAKVFFDQAMESSSAQFEDDDDRQFTLLYQGGGYVLVRR